MSITIVGLGAGDISQISFGAYNELKSGKKIYLRTEKHPIIEFLNIKYTSYDHFYDQGDSFENVYEAISNEVVREGISEDIIYAVPGHPRVAESTVSLIEKYAKIQGVGVSVIPSMSFIDAMYSYLGFDPSEGFRLLDAFDIQRKNLDSNANIIITQVYDRFIASNTKISLMEYYDDDTEIWIVNSAGIKGKERKNKIKLCDLDMESNLFDHITSVFIPKSSNKKFKDIFDLIEITKTLRGDDGCPWDKKQTHESLTRYLIEECYEVIDSIERDDFDLLVEELGDVLYNIVLHCQIGIEEGYFDFDEVCNSISEKMVNRHPHVFGDIEYEKDSADKRWESQKMIEKDETTVFESMSKIPKGLPSLIKAEKIQAKAAKVGFDWDDISCVFDKVKEEYNEFLFEYKVGDFEKTLEEFGDLLFALVNLARFLEIDSEKALNLANTKFLKRFMHVENKVIESGKCFDEVGLDVMESYWQEAKNKN